MSNQRQTGPVLLLPCQKGELCCEEPQELRDSCGCKCQFHFGMTRIELLPCFLVHTIRGIESYLGDARFRYHIPDTPPTSASGGSSHED